MIGPLVSPGQRRRHREATKRALESKLRVPRMWKPRIRRVAPMDGRCGWEVRPTVSRHFGKMYWCEGLADAFRYAHEMYDVTRERFQREARLGSDTGD